jgi:hypothetical protein
VHVGEDGCDRSCFPGSLGWRLRSPDGRVEVFDQDLIHAIIGGKDLGGGSTELSVNLKSTRGHGSCSLALTLDR